MELLLNMDYAYLCAEMIHHQFTTTENEKRSNNTARAFQRGPSVVESLPDQQEIMTRKEQTPFDNAKLKHGDRSMPRGFPKFRCAWVHPTAAPARLCIVLKGTHVQRPQLSKQRGKKR